MARVLDPEGSSLEVSEGLTRLLEATQSSRTQGRPVRVEPPAEGGLGSEEVVIPLVYAKEEEVLLVVRAEGYFCKGVRTSEEALVLAGLAEE